MEINQISFSYDGKTDRLKEISTRIPEGKITSVIGPNGSGKSTLLGALSQHHRPHSGGIVLDGRDLAAYKPKELAKRLAVVHQHNEAPPDMTVEKLVSYGRLPYRSLLKPESEEDRQAMEWALSCTGLLDKRELRLTQLSGGEQQRVWVAMSLAQRTPLLLLDEPTTYLDIYHQIELLELIRTLNREHGLTIVMVLHDMNQAIRYSDRILVMKEGRLEAEGTPEEIVTAEMIKEIYGVRAVVKHDEESGLHMVPLGI